MIGQTIAHYRVVQHLGSGGMGEVYLAADTNLDRQVALKFLPRHFSTDPEARLRFQREAKALAALNHPNIVAVHDVGEFDGQPYIVMEFVEGQSLKKLIASESVSADMALDVIIQASDGLAAAHKRDIVHRDIKSENIVMSSEGRVKLMDFGLATWRGVTKITAENSTLGTRAYMSPEQSLGQKVDHRTDLWSMGVVLYELITGRLPFIGEHDSAIAYSISNETPEPLARYKADVSPELQRIISKCLAKNPDERYQSAADLTADLRILRSTGSMPAFRAATKPRGKRRLVPIISVAVVAIVAIVVGSVWRPFKGGTNEAKAGRKMLAVLPFENLGPKDQEYFADGMTEEITSRLASISGLGVISRTSVMQYKENKKPLRDVGRELGVDYVIEGTVRWDQVGDTGYVRITPQLIRVKDDTHIWSDRFERPLERIFALQADIAEQVVRALDVTLLAPERHSLSDRREVNVEAYNFYLRGRELYDRIGDYDSFEPIIEMFGKAIAADTHYALAYAALSQTHARAYHETAYNETQLHQSDTNARISRESAARALQLEPDLPEAHLAMGYYYHWCDRDDTAAMREFSIAEKGKSSNSELLLAMGSVQRRRGEWQAAYKSWQRAASLDPASSEKIEALASICAQMRRYHEADSILSRGIELYPTQLVFYTDLALYRWRASGEPMIGKAVLDTAATRLDFPSPGYVEVFYAANRDYDTVLADVLRTEDWSGPQNPWPSVSYAYIADLYGRLQQPEMSRIYLDSAIAVLEDMPDSLILADRGLLAYGFAEVFSQIGRCSDAVRLTKAWSEQIPLSNDAVEGANRLAILAWICARCGHEEEAIDIFEVLLSLPGSLSVGVLRSDDSYDPLRENPRFQALIDRGDIVF